MKRRAMFLSLIFLGACASGGPGDISRFFQRPELAQLKLQTVEVVVVTTNPLVAGPRLEFQTFNPPQIDQAVLIEGDSPSMSAALKLSLTKYLEKAGYQVVSRRAAGRPTPTPPVVKASTTAIGLAETSSAGLALVPLTTDTSTPSMTPTANETVKPAVVTSLSTSTKLKEILATSSADAVLIVRAVAVDAFQIIRDNQAVILNPNDPNQSGSGQAGTREVFPSDGRLLFGQAFLFDKQTGLRLWSRQLPDFPTTNELSVQHPQLNYGYVRNPEELPLAEPAKAARAASAFTPLVLKDFPKSQSGKATARKQLEQIDVGAERRLQQRRDKSSISFELGVGWGYETADTRVRLDTRTDDTVDLSQGAVAPSGIVRFTPRIGYQSPNGYRLHLGVPIGFVPNNFARTYHRDSPRASVRAQIGRGLAIGAEAGIAFPFYLNPETTWAPEASLFADNWSFKSETPANVSPTSQLRVGVLLGVSLTRRFGQSSPFFGRIAARTRLGFNASRSKGLVGFGVTGGAGFSF